MIKILLPSVKKEEWLEIEKNKNRCLDKPCQECEQFKGEEFMDKKGVNSCKLADKLEEKLKKLYPSYKEYLKHGINFG